MSASSYTSPACSKRRIENENLNRPRAKESLSVILEFYDQDDVKVHDRFQMWRRKHPDGFFINCRSKKSWMLHRVECHHPGGTHWTVEEGGSLTRLRKICSVNRRELLELGGRKLKTCNDCSP